ncbi:response regulator [Rhizobium etli]|nr:response regulator [Rhizobium sp. IE4771]
MSQGNLNGKKVLVVEDEYLQARTIADALIEHGADVIGPFPTVEKALLHCGPDEIDGAILDVKVGDVTSFPIAESLCRDGIPFIFLTGYDREIIPPRFKSVPHYLKPFVGRDAPTALALAIARGRSGSSARSERETSHETR